MATTVEALASKKIKGMRPARALLVGLLAPLLALVLLDLLDVRGHTTDLIRGSGVIVVAAALVLTPLVIFRFLGSFGQPSAGQRVVALVGTLILSALWFGLGFLVFVNLHLRFGGSI